ncbi:MAG TPA: CBS domain-containing protein [Burkholderiaceae bacterium]|nr:CBS domain-containing protein [Burkholderiaceae bacterium]
MRIGEICTREVVYCTRATAVAEAAQLMRNNHVGDLIVVDQRDGCLFPVGIVTDRDLVLEVLAENVDPATVKAGDVMGPDLATVRDTDVVYDAIATMRSKGIRRLPVVDARGCLVGVLTADDVAEFLAEELSGIARVAPRQLQVEEKRRAPVRS